MRNSKYLDNPRPEDEKIGELESDKGGDFRMINGKKHYQTIENKDRQLIINRFRASGMSKPSEYLKSTV